uniref:Regulator of G protein signaling 19 n=1 Tax=Poecilia reticulata TaxID=8081 RepID=A0A3P9NBU2_POERE
MYKLCVCVCFLPENIFHSSSHSPKPSVEEVRMWSQSFDKLMRNPAGRNVFREFLRTEYSEENMLFWLACEDLKQEINKSTLMCQMFCTCSVVSELIDQ